MNSSELMDSFMEFKDLKNIDKQTMQHVLEDVFRAMLKKKFNTDEHIDVIVNVDKGDVQIFLNKEIVDDGEVEDPNTEIAYSDAIKIEPDFEIGEEVTEEFKFVDFGRRNVLSLRQNLVAKVQELERDNVYKKYKERIGEIITAEVYQVWKKEILLTDDEGNEVSLPKTDQIPSDFFKKGDTVRAVVSRVEMRNGNASIIISRTAPEFLERLFELEVPEVFDGLITIKKTVREPGERAKVAVESYDDRIDPVGACVGMKGSRIHGIVRELRNENIDVINYTSNLQLMVQRALAPAKVTSMEVFEEQKRIKAYMRPDQVSLAIGKGGYNIKLAGLLVGYIIDVFRDGEMDNEDVDLEEFVDEIDSWIIDELKAIGCDTAKAVLEISVEELEQRTDLEKETIEEVFRILKAEFE
jgi:transcription termination/antitermination protein NusA